MNLKKISQVAVGHFQVWLQLKKSKKSNDDCVTHGCRSTDDNSLFVVSLSFGFVSVHRHFITLFISSLSHFSRYPRRNVTHAESVFVFHDTHDTHAVSVFHDTHAEGVVSILHDTHAESVKGSWVFRIRGCWFKVISPSIHFSIWFLGSFWISIILLPLVFVFFFLWVFPLKLS